MTPKAHSYAQNRLAVQLDQGLTATSTRLLIA
jgi:hypothetical protein